MKSTQKQQASVWTVVTRREARTGEGMTSPISSAILASWWHRKEASIHTLNTARDAGSRGPHAMARCPRVDLNNREKKGDEEK